MLNPVLGLSSAARIIARRQGRSQGLIVALAVRLGLDGEEERRRVLRITCKGSKIGNDGFEAKCGNTTAQPHPHVVVDRTPLGVLKDEIRQRSSFAGLHRQFDGYRKPPSVRSE